MRGEEEANIWDALCPPGARFELCVVFLDEFVLDAGIGFSFLLKWKKTRDVFFNLCENYF